MLLDTVKYYSLIRKESYLARLHNHRRPNKAKTFGFLGKGMVYFSLDSRALTNKSLVLVNTLFAVKF